MRIYTREVLVHKLIALLIPLCVCPCVWGIHLIIYLFILSYMEVFQRIEMVITYPLL